MTVAELLENSESWCQRAYAMNKDGWGVPYNDPSAVSWCLRGAIAKCYPDLQSYVISLNAVAEAIDPKDFWSGHKIAEWNDNINRTHQEVLDVLRKAKI